MFQRSVYIYYVSISVVSFVLLNHSIALREKRLGEGAKNKCKTKLNVIRCVYVQDDKKETLVRNKKKNKNFNKNSSS